MPASTVAARFQRASDGGVLPSIVVVVSSCTDGRRDHFVNFLI
jgi:hypothetical protein